MQASQIILRKSVLGRTWVNVSLDEAKLCLGCLFEMSEGSALIFGATQLFYLPPLGFLPCAVLIAPAPVLFYYSHPRSSLLCFEDQIQNKASQHSKTGMWGLVSSVEVRQGLQLHGMARETSLAWPFWSQHIHSARLGSIKFRQGLKCITDMPPSSLVLVTQSAITQAMPQHRA